MSDFFYFVALVIFIGLALLVPPALKAMKIGDVKCNRCGNVGKLKQTITNKLVCTKCGSEDWKPKDAAV